MEASTWIPDARLDRHRHPPAGVLLQAAEINSSTVFAGQKVGVMQVTDEIWLVSFMHYDLGYFDVETCRLEPIANPFGPKLHVSGIDLTSVAEAADEIA